MSAAKQVLAATTDATQSDKFFVTAGKPVTVMTSPDLGSGETADIQISPDGGETWNDYQDGAAVELTNVKNALRLYGPALYRVDKDATASSVGIFVQFPVDTF